METNRDNKKGTNNDCVATMQVTVSDGVRAIAPENVVVWAIQRHVCECLDDPQIETGDILSHFRNVQLGVSFVIVTEPLTRTISVMLPEEFHGPMM